MAKKKKMLLDPKNMDDLHAGVALFEQYLRDLATSAESSNAGCVSMTIRAGDGTVGDGQYIPEIMLRVRKP